MKIKKQIKNIFITILILALSFGFSLLLKDVFKIADHITTVFVFAVFLISLITDGYLYGIAAAIIGVVAVNFAFVFPFFKFQIALQENAFSALVMIVISLMTSTLTTKLKQWQGVKAESEGEKMRANLLRAVSHDIRTPLTTIYGSSSTILDSYPQLSDEQKKQLIHGIKEDSEWLIRMVENLLSITKIDSGNVKLIKTATVLDELIDSVLLKFKKRYPDTEVSLELPAEIVIIPMDAILIEQVIVNLLDNAVQHAKGMTKLSLNVYADGEDAVFEVSDNGCGIAKDRLDKMFYSYFDADHNDRHGKNAGIGLSVCASIIKAHEGRITAENISGGGALFRFILSMREDSSHEQ